MKSPRLLVLGDLMLDEYVWGAAERISPEAPVPVVRAQSRSYTPGGAANVIANIQSLGGSALAFGVIGNDASGEQLVRELSALGADTSGVVIEPKRATTLKTRIMAQRQQIVRVDQEQIGAIADASVRSMLNRIRQVLPSIEAVVLSDYGKGVLRRSLVQPVLEAARERGIPVVGGPKPDTLSRFAGATLLSFNRSEASAAARSRLSDHASIEAAGSELLQNLDLQALAITLGGGGVAFFLSGKSIGSAKRKGVPRSRSIHHELFDAHAVEVFDVAGAGDTFLAATALAHARGRSLRDAVEYGNLAAAGAVRRVGVVAVTPHDLEAVLRSDPPNSMRAGRSTSRHRLR